MSNVTNDTVMYKSKPPPSLGFPCFLRYGWLAEGDEEQYVASCYHGQHCQQARESLRQGIRGRQRGKLIKRKQMLNKKIQERKILLTVTDTSSIVALLEKMVNTTNWGLKLEPSFRLSSIIVLVNKHKLLGKLGVVDLLEKIVNEG
jgi:hypothetical protein